MESCTDALETSLEKPGILIDPRASCFIALAAMKSATCSKDCEFGCLATENSQSRYRNAEKEVTNQFFNFPM